MKKILVVNAGSSTIKWKLFSNEDFSVLAEGVAERLFVDGVITTKYQDKKNTREVALNSHKDASEEIFKDLESLNIITDRSEVKNIGFRIVQGGDIFEKTTILNEKEINQIKELATLAPLHNGPAVQAIRSFQNIFPDAILTGTFDTSFHTTINEINSTYPIKKELAKELKIKKYGAHGTSHKFITKKLEKELNKDKVTFLNMHIGSGASLCAVKDSKSFDTSMGLTPLAGIMMGTRSGDIDPSIHEYVCEQKGISIKEFTQILNKESGMQGMTGFQDLRDVENEVAKGNKEAILATEIYVQKIVDYSALYINKLGSKIDAIVFTAGVGENASIIREKVIDKISVINVKIDKEKNNGSSGDVTLISASDSEVPIYVIRTDEELMIAKEAKEANV